MLVAALSCSAAPLAAIEATVAGHPVELTGHLEVRQVLKANQSTAGDRTLEQLWAHVETPLNDFIRPADDVHGAERRADDTVGQLGRLRL